MGIKIHQLKKFSVKALKVIVKKHKLGKVSKKKKAQLIGLISNCDECKNILSKMTLPIKKVKKFSKKQLDAQQKFKAMVQDKSNKLDKSVKKIKKDIKKLEDKGISELKDLARDKGIFKVEELTKKQLINVIETGKNSLKELEETSMAIELKPIVKDIKKKVVMKKEVKEIMEDIIEVKENLIENKKKRLSKRDFLDSIFGVSKFNLRREIKDIMDEIDGEKLDIFLSLSKKNKKELLQRRFDSAMSLSTLINKHIK